MSVRHDFERLRATQLYAPGRRIDPGYRSGEWAGAIDRLLGARYSFAAETFGDEGFLFRGLRRGLREGIATGRFGPDEGDAELSLFEAVAGVVFVSHELRDALAVCRSADAAADSALLVVPAAVFHRAHAAGEAAVLAVGDSGVVFRYPLLARPLALAEVAFVVTAEEGVVVPAGWPGRVLPPFARPAFRDEDAVGARLAEQGVAPARPLACDRWPVIRR